VDSNTQKLNTRTLASGNTLRFNGLVFNDNGTLRMDCAQVNDGVSLTPQSNSAVQSHAQVKTLLRTYGEGLHTVTTVSRSAAN
jgi:hypothetical protein